MKKEFFIVIVCTKLQHTLLSEKILRVESEVSYLFKLNQSKFCKIGRFSPLRIFYASSVSSAQEVMKYVRYGMRERHEDATKIHAHSSRSHLIVQLTLYTSSGQHSSAAKVTTTAASPTVTPRGTKTGGAHDKDQKNKPK